MTISLFSGTPGSGKSYHAVERMYKRLTNKSLEKKNMNTVIANFPLNSETNKQDLIYYDNSEILDPDIFIDYAIKNHMQGVEAQTLVVLDEAQILFNSRDWGSNSNRRMDWIKFFSQHRKYGYDFILIAQYDRMIDRQIRSLVEYEVAHIKMNNVFWYLPIFKTYFLAVTRWYGQRMKLFSDIIFYNKKVGKLYNTFSTFTDTEEEKKKFFSVDKNKDVYIPDFIIDDVPCNDAGIPERIYLGKNNSYLPY